MIYKALREEAREAARREVRQEIRLEEARSLILRQLTRKIGEMPSTTKAQLEQLDLAALEDLGEALLGFVTLEDLNAWLGRSPS